MKKLFVLFTMFLFFSCSKESSTPEATVSMSVVTQVIPFKSTDGIYNIAYHIKLSNFQLEGLELIKAEILNNDDQSILRTYADSTLAANFKAASDPLPTQQELYDGTEKLPNPYLLVWLRVDPSKIPSTILHRMTFKETSGSLRQITVENITSVSNTSPIVIASPVKGEYWYVQGTTTDDPAHFAGIASLKGHTTCDGLFAVDMLLFNSAGQYFANTGMQNEDHFCYGQDLYAVADGIVVTARDIYQDTPVGQLEHPNMLYEHYCGNEVVIDIGNGNFADYTHLKPGSVNVKVGDVVKKGDIVAKIGNSGASSGPHLHFEICCSNPPWHTYGVPYVIDKFVLYYSQSTGVTNLTFTNTLYENRSVLHFIF